MTRRPFPRDVLRPAADPATKAGRAPRLATLWVSCASIALLSPTAGKTQSLFDRSLNTPVASRPHPEYEALGIRTGGFTVYPRLSLSGGYDDNVYGLPNKRSDFLGILAGTVEFASNWSRHAADVRLRYERDQYARESSQSSNEFALNSTGRIDVDHASAINLTFNAARLTEARTAPGSFASLARPVRYDLVTAGIAGFRESGRLRVDADLTSNTYRFQDTPLVGGGVFPESLRNETSLNERLRLSYAQSPNLAGFVEVRPNQNYFEKSGLGVVFPFAPGYRFTNLDSSGYAVLGGVNVQLTHLITGDFGIGYLRQTYKDPSIPDVSGLAVNVDARYFPTQLVTVTFHGDHSIQPSGLPGTSAMDADNARVLADYEFLRNVLITPQVSVSRLRYAGVDRTDWRYGAGLNASYLVNRMLGLTLSYSYLKQTSSGAARGYRFDDNRLSFSVTLQR